MLEARAPIQHDRQSVNQCVHISCSFIQIMIMAWVRRAVRKLYAWADPVHTDKRLVDCVFMIMAWVRRAVQKPRAWADPVQADKRVVCVNIKDIR